MRKLIVHSKNPDGQKRQKAIAILGVIGPKDSESIMRAIAHGLADKEVTTLSNSTSGGSKPPPPPGANPIFCQHFPKSARN